MACRWLEGEGVPQLTYTWVLLMVLNILEKTWNPVIKSQWEPWRCIISSKYVSLMRPDTIEHSSLIQNKIDNYNPY